MRDFFVRYCVMGAGISLSVLAFMKLFSSVFELDYVQSILFVIEAYALLVNVVIGWMEPVANAIVNAIIRFFQVSLSLGNDWKDIFVLLSIYFLRECSVAFSDKKTFTGIYLFFVGTSISLVVSVLTSSLRLEEARYLQFLIIIVPITGIFVYEVLASIWKASRFFSGAGSAGYFVNLRTRLFFVCRRWVVAFSATLITYLVLNVTTTSVSSYQLAWFVVVLYVVGLSLEWMRVGEAEARRVGSKEVIWKRVVSANTGKVGFGMLSVVLIAAFVAMLSAQLKF